MARPFLVVVVKRQGSERPSSYSRRHAGQSEGQPTTPRLWAWTNSRWRPPMVFAFLYSWLRLLLDLVDVRLRVHNPEARLASACDCRNRDDNDERAGNSLSGTYSSGPLIGPPV